MCLVQAATGVKKSGRKNNGRKYMRIFVAQCMCHVKSLSVIDCSKKPITDTVFSTGKHWKLAL